VYISTVGLGQRNLGHLARLLGILVLSPVFFDNIAVQSR